MPKKNGNVRNLQLSQERWNLLFQILAQINERLDSIMASQQELADHLNKVGDQLDKAQKEITDAVQALKDALASAGATTPEVDAAVSRLDTAAQSLDDINPDQPPTP